MSLAGRKIWECAIKSLRFIIDDTFNNYGRFYDVKTKMKLRFCKSAPLQNIKKSFSILNYEIICGAIRLFWVITNRSVGLYINI